VKEAHRTENYCLTIFSLVDTPPPVHQYCINLTPKFIPKVNLFNSLLHSPRDSLKLLQVKLPRNLVKNIKIVPSFVGRKNSLLIGTGGTELNHCDHTYSLDFIAC